MELRLTDTNSANDAKGRALGLAVADPAKTPGLLPVELEQKMAEQNQLVASLIEQNDALTKELTKLGQQLAELRQKQGTKEN